MLPSRQGVRDRAIEPVRDPHLVELLAPFHDVVMRVRCGTCGLVYGHAFVAAPGAPAVVTIERTLRPGVTSRPQVEMEQPDELTYIEGGRMRLTCRRRCNRGRPRRWVVTPRSAASAFATAARAGGRELVFGVNI